MIHYLTALEDQSVEFDFMVRASYENTYLFLYFIQTIILLLLITLVCLRSSLSTCSGTLPRWKCNYTIRFLYVYHCQLQCGAWASTAYFLFPFWYFLVHGFRHCIRPLTDLIDFALGRSRNALWVRLFRRLRLLRCKLRKFKHLVHTTYVRRRMAEGVSDA